MTIKTAFVTPDKGLDVDIPVTGVYDALPIATAVYDHDGETTVASTTVAEATTGVETTASSVVVLGHGDGGGDGDLQNKKDDEANANAKKCLSTKYMILLVGGLGVVAAIIIFILISRRSQFRDGTNYSNSTNTNGYNSNSNSGGGGWWFGKSTSGVGSTIGGGGGSCFPAGEMVELAATRRRLLIDDEREEPFLVPIEHIRPGDIAVNGGKVTAVMKFLYEPASILIYPDGQKEYGETLYRYNNSVCVTGSHSVPLNTKNNATASATASERLVWQAVEDSMLAVLDHQNLCGPPATTTTIREGNHNSPFYLYNLVTEQHQVVINGTLLADWEEADVPTDSVSERALLHQLNHGGLNQPNIIADQRNLHVDTDDATIVVGEGGFAPFTLVDTEEGPINIQYLEPGDILAHDTGEVVAAVQLLVSGCNGNHSASDANSSWWSYNDHIIASPWTIVLDPTDRIWRHVKDSSRSRQLRGGQQSREASTCILYQLITSTHQIPIEGTFFADYEVL
jgi:hypothetical protein